MGIFQEPKQITLFYAPNLVNNLPIIGTVPLLDPLFLFLPALVDEIASNSIHAGSFLLK